MLRKHLPLVASLLLVSFAEARYGDGVWGFGGVGIGGLILNTNVKNPDSDPVTNGAKEQNKTGYTFHAKAGLSWYTGPNFVVDAMGGWLYSDIRGHATDGNDSIVIRHQLGLFQLSPRYRFGELGKWQLGPLYKLYFGSDTKYAETQSDRSSKTTSNYLGLHLNYDIPSATERTIYRFGLEAFTDVGDPRRAYIANLLFEIGFDLFGGEGSGSRYRELPERTERLNRMSEPRLQQNVDPLGNEDLLATEPNRPVENFTDDLGGSDANAVATSTIGNSVQIRFPGDRFQFQTAMSHIGSKKTREYIRELGEFLAQNPNEWQQGLVVGHTDPRGPPGREREVNIELSEGRARTVFNALVAAGVEPSKLRSEGRAFDEPVRGTRNNAKGWRLDRRVELSFTGVASPARFVKQISVLNKKYGYGRQRVTK